MKRIPPLGLGRPGSVLLVALAMSFSAGSCKVSCGKGHEKRVEQTIEKQLAKKLDQKVKKVECPEEIDGKEGEITECVATMASGETVRIVVEWTDSLGAFTWETRVEIGDLVKKLRGLIAEGLSRKYEAKFDGVECPEVAPKQGVSFECVATIEGGSRLPVKVNWTDDSGSYEYADKGVILLDKLEALLGEQLAAQKTPGKVDCHGKIRASEPDSVFPCTITYDDGKTELRDITVTDWAGNVRWK